jgi:predicted DCC family thiol-disulfide oxidoreductase YuxK
MITLADEFTDRKERRARGWLFFDAECRFCTRVARWLGPVLRRRGLGVAPLQDPRVGALLGLSKQALLKELRFLDGDGSQSGGADAVVALARQVWWGRPLVWVAGVPGMTAVLARAYRSVAARRGCGAQLCAGERTKASVGAR